MRPKTINIDLDAVDPNGLFEDQTTTGTANLVLNGAGVTGGVWTSPDGFPKRIGFESSANLSGVTLTVTGTADVAGNIPLVETLSAPNANTVETTGYFGTITSVGSSGSLGTNIEAGPVDEAVSQVIPVNWRGGPIAMQAVVTGTVNYTVQHTFDDVQTIANHPLTWVDTDATGLVAATATAKGAYVANPRALRVKVNSYSTGAAIEFSVIQSDV